CAAWLRRDWFSWVTSVGKLRLSGCPGNWGRIKLAINIGFRGTANQQLLTKLFVGSIVTEAQWLSFRKNLTERIGLRLPEKAPIYMNPDQQLEIFTPNGNRTFQPLDEIETLLSPVLLCMKGRPAVITPIQKEFSEELLGHSAQMSFLPLRSSSLFKDKHYLSDKKNLKHFRRGNLILFYESAKKGGRKSIIALARCRHSYLRSGDDIEGNDLERSVLTKDSLKRIGKSNMKAVAVFDNIHVMKQPIPLSFLKRIGCGRDTDLISTKKISDSQLQSILKEALS
ncbi:MAG: hypothetical protein Q8J78_11495, partial [Moraxellaceae bacterium]|nr:hypothetical protein [Moraxellaceae bacterium]